MAARVRRCADYTLVDAILRPPGVFRDTGRSGGSRPRNPDFGTEAVRPTPLAPRQQALTACAKYDPSVLKICRNFGSCALSPRAPRHLRPAASTRRPPRNLARSIGTMAGWEGRDRLPCNDRQRAILEYRRSMEPDLVRARPTVRIFGYTARASRGFSPTNFFQHCLRIACEIRDNITNLRNCFRFGKSPREQYRINTLRFHVATSFRLACDSGLPPPGWLRPIGPPGTKTAAPGPSLCPAYRIHRPALDDPVPRLRRLPAPAGRQRGFSSSPTRPGPRR